MTTVALLPTTLRPARVVFDGPLTIYTATEHKTQLHAALENADHDGLELDVGQVTEIDSAGLQLLLLARRECQRLQRPLSIVSVSTVVREVIVFCQLGNFFGEALAPGALG